jgi:hypothetical protein
MLAENKKKAYFQFVRGPASVLRFPQGHNVFYQQHRTGGVYHPGNCGGRRRADGRRPGTDGRRVD